MHHYYFYFKQLYFKDTTKVKGKGIFAYPHVSCLQCSSFFGGILIAVCGHFPSARKTSFNISYVAQLLLMTFFFSFCMSIKSLGFFKDTFTVCRIPT